MPLNPFDEALAQTPRPTNPFDDVVGEMKQGRTSAVTVAVDQAGKKNPDQQADYIRMADQLRVPLAVIERNPDAYRGAAQLQGNDFDSLIRDTPHLARTLVEKPEFAAVAHDDLPALASMEQAIHRAGSIAKAAGWGPDQLGRVAYGVRSAGAGLYRGLTTGFFGMLQQGAERQMAEEARPAAERSPFASNIFTNASAMAQWAKAHRQASVATAQRIQGPQPEGMGRFGQLVSSGIESFGMSVPGTLATIATKNPDIAYALMGVQTTGEAYWQAADQGVNQAKAGIFAGVQGSIEMLTEATPLGWLLRDLGGGAGFIKTLAHQALHESIGEEAATAMQDLAEFVMLPENQGKGWLDYVKARPQAFLDTLVATVASVGATTGVATGVHSLITSLGDAATQSKTAKRSPEAVEHFVGQATADSPAKAVYAPIETWTSYWQSKGEDPATMAAQVTGDPQAYEKAQALGTDLEIPLAKYAAKLAGTEHNAFFANELKLDPAEMNARESQAYVDQLQQSREATGQPTETAQASEQAAQIMIDRMVAQGIPQETAETYGAIWKAGIVTLAEKFGIDPLELQARYGPGGGPTVTREGMEPAPTPEQVPAEAPPTETPEGTPAEVPGPEPEAPDTILAPALAQMADLRQQLGTAQEERRAAERLAETDALTGVGNPRALEKALPAAEADPNTSVLFFDANNFGLINKQTTGGHPAGDALLKHLAASLQQAAEEGGAGGRVFRRGGDEFVILVPKAQATQIRQRAETLFGTHAFTDKQGRPFEVSVSGSEGATVAEAEAPLQEAKAARKSPLGPPNAQGERALFIGMQETGTDDPAFALYRVQGGPHEGTTVTEAELQQWGIPIPQAQTVLNQEQKWAPRFQPTPDQRDTLNEELDGLTQRIRDDAVPGAQLEAFINNAGELYIDTIRIPESARGTGIGSAMIRPLLEWADTHNLQVALTPAPDKGKKGALDRFYQRLGFVRNGQARGFYDPSSAGSRVRPSVSERRSTTLYQELGGKRGEIRFGADRQFNIHLLEQADLSTFLHETGHFFLEVFGDLTDELAQREALTPEHERLKNDYTALLQWLGVESRAEVTREQHEQFARGFEAYLMEGKAPSVELRSVFARARAWLLGIYRSLRNLNVTLTPEVRGVFDRMLASDAAIQEAQSQANVSALFTTAESAGMSAAEFANYRGTIEDASRKAKEEIDRKLLSEVQREQTATWKAQREAIRQQVESEMQQQPVYRALSAMQKGTHPNGESLIDGETPAPLKLSKAIISERYGPERLKALPKPYVYSREGGLDPDTVAEMFGFSSGDALLSAVSTAQPMRSVIERETASRMFQQHGSLLLDGTLIDKAQAAVANDTREKVITIELTALVKAMRARTKGGAATIRAGVANQNVIRQAAQQEVARMRIGDIRPQRYWAAGNKAGRQAVEFAARQQFPEAIKAKTQQLVNLALYREAVKQRDEVETRTQWVRDHDTATARGRTAEAGGSYLDQWDGMLDRYEFKRVPQNVLDRRARLDKWIASQKAEGEAIDLPEAVLDDARRINYRQMTVEEFTGVTDGLKQLLHFAQLKRKLLGRQAARELNDIAMTVAERVYRTGAGTTTAPRLTRHTSMLEKVRKYGRDLGNSFLNADTLLRELDGWEDLGPVYEHIKGGIDRAVVEDLIPRTNAAAEKLAEINSVYKRGELQKRVEIKALNDSLTREEIIAFALNWGTADNRAALLESKKWAAIGANEQTAQAILGQLDERDAKYVQSVWDYIETFWPEIEASQKRRKGVATAKVEAVPFETKHGTTRGGYYPLKYDSEGSILAKQDQIEDTLERMRTGRYAAAATRDGFAQERVGSGGRPVLLSLSVIAQHVGEVNYDLALGDEIRSADRVLRHRTVRDAFDTTGAHGSYEALGLWLHDVATGEIGAADVLSKSSRWIRSGLTISALGFNLGTAAMNIVAPSQSAVVIGKRALLRGMTDVVTHKWFGDGNIFEQVIDASPFMAERQTTFNKDISTAMEHVKDSRVPRVVHQSVFYVITKSQWLADVATWLGAHQKGLVQFEGDSDKATAYADRMVARSQGSGLWADRTAIERGTISQSTRQSEFVKMWTTLMSYMLAKGNVAFEKTANRNFRSPSQIAGWTVDMVLLFGVEALFAGMLHGQFDDDDDWGTFFGHWLLETGRNMVQTLPFAREVEAGMSGYPTGGPIGSAVNRIGSAYKQVEQGEFDAALVKALNTAGGMFFHYPSSAINRIITAGTKAQDGEDVSLLDYLIYREDGGKSR